MTKEEKIKEAWDNTDGLNKNNWANYWTYDKAKKHGMDIDGWIKVCGYEPEEGMVYDLMRPPQLEGIEYNNGWIKIESEDDLPKEDMHCFIMFNDLSYSIDLFYKEGGFLRNHWKHILYYQPIEKPKTPIY